MRRCHLVIMHCNLWNFDLLLTLTSEEGPPLFREEVVEYFSLSLFVGAMSPFARTGRPFASRYLVLKYLGVYGFILGTPEPCALKSALI